MAQQLVTKLAQNKINDPSIISNIIGKISFGTFIKNLSNYIKENRDTISDQLTSILNQQISGQTQTSCFGNKTKKKTNDGSIQKEDLISIIDSIICILSKNIVPLERFLLEIFKRNKQQFKHIINKVIDDISEIPINKNKNGFGKNKKKKLLNKIFYIYSTLRRKSKTI